MPSCKYNGSEYAPGSVICMAGAANRCRDDGSWEDLDEPCVQGDGIVIREADGEKPLPAD